MSEHPHHPDHPSARASRFARIRRVKQLLRFMPRRASLHKYPIVGRFAAAARRRAYLWSFRPPAIRPAFYAGSILSLLPVMGVQLPLSFLLALLLRANFMVLGGLQLLTNPFTAAPLYYATHQLGAYVIRAAGFGESPTAADPGEALLPLAEDETAIVYLAPPLAPATWTQRIGTAINALIVGGVISGAALGLLLDILYRNFWLHHTHAPPRRKPAA